MQDCRLIAALRPFAGPCTPRLGFLCSPLSANCHPHRVPCRGGPQSQTDNRLPSMHPTQGQTPHVLTTWPAVARHGTLHCQTLFRDCPPVPAVNPCARNGASSQSRRSVSPKNIRVRPGATRCASSCGRSKAQTSQRSARTPNSDRSRRSRRSRPLNPICSARAPGCRRRRPA